MEGPLSPCPPPPWRAPIPLPSPRHGGFPVPLTCHHHVPLSPFPAPPSVPSHPCPIVFMECFLCLLLCPLHGGSRGLHVPLSLPSSWVPCPPCPLLTMEGLFSPLPCLLPRSPVSPALSCSWRVLSFLSCLLQAGCPIYPFCFSLNFLFTPLCPCCSPWAVSPAPPLLRSCPLHGRSPVPTPLTPFVEAFLFICP